MPWGAIAAIGGALIGSDASRSASNKQLDAARESNALQKDMYDQTVTRNAPFVSGGTASFNALLDRLGLSGNTSAPGYGTFGKMPTAADVMAEPGYQFGLQQGQENLDRKLNANGRLYGGSALAAAARYGNDYATSKYDNAFNRMQGAERQAFGEFGNLANLGQNSANNTAQAGATYANAFGNNTQLGAQYAGQNSLAQGNIWQNAINQGASAYRNRPSPTGTVGPGAYENTDPSSYYAQNGSDVGWNPSDRRLKTNIRRIGSTPSGNAWYSWDWRDGSGSSEGVIAQEVQHIPGAVQKRADGMLTVDYSKV
jgi:hypothetical protein